MQIRGVTSESLEARIRSLLPSQNGFSEELSAQNLIVPIIDLTSAAEGSSLDPALQNSIAAGSMTAHAVNNTTTDIITTTGFYRLVGAFSYNDNDSAVLAQIIAYDGATDKIVWGLTPYGSGGASTNQIAQIDMVFFCDAGDIIRIKAVGTYTYFYGSTRQLATFDGTLVNPSGFVSQ